MCGDSAPGDPQPWEVEAQEGKPGVELCGGVWELPEPSKETPVPFLGRHLEEAPGESA